MSKLLKDAAAFKATMQRQDFTSWHSQQQNPSSSNIPTPADSSLPNAGDDVVPSPKKKRPKSSMTRVFSLFGLFLSLCDDQSFS
jgi:transcription initiation factor TFIIE subunit beta